jgi:TorA maturation chaperone TorD
MEDHVSAVCDVMRWLIECGRPVQEQRAFFEKFVHPGVVPFCGAIHSGSSAAFYRAVASFARAFLGVEKDAFDLHIE